MAASNVQRCLQPRTHRKAASNAWRCVLEHQTAGNNTLCDDGVRVEVRGNAVVGIVQARQCKLTGTSNSSFHDASYPVYACAALSTEFNTAVEGFLKDNKVTAFIKGNKDFPQCGFSNTVVQVRCAIMSLIAEQMDSVAKRRRQP